MAGRNPQTQAKRARELALRERRERKQAKKAQTADERAAERIGEADESHRSAHETEPKID